MSASSTGASPDPKAFGDPCCHGVHDVAARLDKPGFIRFVTLCTGCGAEQREVGREPYVPEPKLARSAGGGAGEAELRDAVPQLERRLEALEGSRDAGDVLRQQVSVWRRLVPRPGEEVA